MSTQPTVPHGKRRYRKRDVAARYGVHPVSIWRWVNQGKFPTPEKINGMSTWREEVLDAYDEQLIRDTAVRSDQGVAA